MTRLFQALQSLALAVGMAFLAIPLPAGAEVPRPDIPQANARYSETQGCVEPTEEMRKNHMEYILHQRDETLRQGVRGSKYSLAECINCHVPKQESGKVVRSDSKEHFCSSCHSYAAVKIDCFSCHRDTPMPDAEPGLHRLGGGKGHHFTDTETELTADVLRAATEEGLQ
ncbi:MAG TPA: hypothetical protein VK971_12090 [Thiohalobacter sp.]|nr:hypothetical protein [Thiohalobacter sp.]